MLDQLFDPTGCAACRELGRCRLGLGPLTGPLLAPQADVVCPAEWEGGPTTAHGGWIAAVFDDFLGSAMVRAGRLSVTGELAIRFLRPVPVGLALELDGQLIAGGDGRWRCTASLRLAGSERILASGSGTWVERGIEHWERHRDLVRSLIASADATSPTSGPLSVDPLTTPR